MQWFGRELNLQELRRLTGDLTQLAGVTPIEFCDGSARGVRALQVRTGAMRFTVVLDRGMDLSEAEVGGIPFGWRTGAGFVHPAFYDPRGDEWLRTYEGGLMTTGGLTQMGEPNVDRGEEHGLHGRIALSPAAETGYRIDWESGDIEIWGTMREVKPLTKSLEVRRRIRAPIGARTIYIEDTVTNRGRKCEPHMMLYHANFGFPLLDEGSRFLAPSLETVGWDQLSEDRRAGYSEIPGFRDEEYVFGHRLARPRGIATAALVNARLCGGAFAALRFDPDELPHLWQWTSLCEGSFVMGIEPGNSDIHGRAAAREAGNLPMLDPGESQSYHVELTFGFGSAAVEDLEREIALQREGGR